MQVEQLRSYRAVLETAPPSDEHQAPQVVTYGIKARSIAHAIAAARAVFALPIRAIYRQDRRAA